MTEMNTLSIQKLLEEIRYDRGRYPHEALDELIIQRDEAIPELVKIVEQVQDSPGFFTDTPERFDHIYAVMLLSQFQAAEAFAPFLCTLQLPDDLAFSLYGDLLMNCGGRIVASLYSGMSILEGDLASYPELDAIFDLIHNTSVDELIRGIGFQAITSLVRQRKVSSDLIQYYYHDLLQGDLDEESDILYSLLIDSCMELKFHELLDEITDASPSRRGNIVILNSSDAMEEDYFHFNNEIRLEKDQYKSIENIHEELAGWFEAGIVSRKE